MPGRRLEGGWAMRICVVGGDARFARLRLALREYGKARGAAYIFGEEKALDAWETPLQPEDLAMIFSAKERVIGGKGARRDARNLRARHLAYDCGGGADWAEKAAGPFDHRALHGQYAGQTRVRHYGYGGHHGSQGAAEKWPACVVGHLHQRWAFAKRQKYRGADAGAERFFRAISSG